MELNARNLLIRTSAAILLLLIPATASLAKTEKSSQPTSAQEDSSSSLQLLEGDVLEITFPGAPDISGQQMPEQPIDYYARLKQRRERQGQAEPVASPGAQKIEGGAGDNASRVMPEQTASFTDLRQRRLEEQAALGAQQGEALEE